MLLIKICNFKRTRNDEFIEIGRKLALTQIVFIGSRSKPLIQPQSTLNWAESNLIYDDKSPNKHFSE